MGDAAKIATSSQTVFEIIHISKELYNQIRDNFRIFCAWEAKLRWQVFRKESVSISIKQRYIQTIYVKVDNQMYVTTIHFYMFCH